VKVGSPMVQRYYFRMLGMAIPVTCSSVVGVGED
jgi:hypothetical protein